MGTACLYHVDNELPKGRSIQNSRLQTRTIEQKKLVEPDTTVICARASTIFGSTENENERECKNGQLGCRKRTMVFRHPKREMFREVASHGERSQWAPKNENIA